VISVCIPTKNAGPEFGRYLRAWHEQKTGEEVEIVVVDSGSRDSTVENAHQLGARVITIPAEEFNHGETRNLLARQARGDLLVFTVQDACPAADNVLAELVRPLRTQPELAAVTGEQAPHPNADAVARWEVASHNAIIAAGPPLKRFARSKPLAGDFLNRLRNVAFDNVCSALRRSVWERIPFAKIDFAEDLDWAVRVLRAGHTLLRNPGARVHHSHNSAPYQRLKRAFVSRRALNRIFEMPSPGRPWGEEEVLPQIGAYLGLLEGARAGLARQPEPVRRLRLETTPGYWVRRALRRARLDRFEPLMVALPHRPVTDALAGSFNAAMRHLLKFHGGLPRAEADKAALQLGLQVLGDFLADSYTTAVAGNQLPDWLEELAGALARNV
jgi:rhamnosyltransferase